MNFLGLLAGIILPLAGLSTRGPLPVAALFVACCPALISFVVLVANAYQRYELARFIYFTLYPVVTAAIYALRLDAVIVFFFVLYDYLSTTFLHYIFIINLSYCLLIT